MPRGSIEDTLRYDFDTEKAFSYRGLTMGQTVKHLAKFTSDIWQIHPFLEGNTRATAVFMIQYLKSLGFQVNNDMFALHSWYLRNALVRANYNDFKNNIYATTEYLEQFFGNLLLGEGNELKNRYMHLDYSGGTVREEEGWMQYQSACYKAAKCTDGTYEQAEE